jgi:hypothetical protein
MNKTVLILITVIVIILLMGAGITITNFLSKPLAKPIQILIITPANVLKVETFQLPTVRNDSLIISCRKSDIVLVQ